MLDGEKSKNKVLRHRKGESMSEAVSSRKPVRIPRLFPKSVATVGGKERGQEVAGLQACQSGHIRQREVVVGDDNPSVTQVLLSRHTPFVEFKDGHGSSKPKPQYHMRCWKRLEGKRRKGESEGEEHRMTIGDNNATEGQLSGRKLLAGPSTR